jgi:hypothetical protein
MNMLSPRVRAGGEDLDLRPTSSHTARQEAAQAVPLEKLHPDDRRLAETIIHNASLYRRLPTKIVACDPRLFSLFMQHPQAVVNLWEVMGISKVRMAQIDNNAYQAHDGNGTHGTVRMLECVCDDNAQNRAVVLASGTYQGSGITGPVEADCLALVRSGSVRDRHGTAFVTARIDVFIYLPQVGVDLVARTLQPLLVRVADRNFIQTMDFVSSFSEAAAKNPRGIERLAAHLEQTPLEVRSQLTSIAYGMSQSDLRVGHPVELPGRGGQKDRTRYSRPSTKLASEEN